MSTAPVVDVTEPGSDLDMNHFTCCIDDDVALCGTSLVGHPYTDEDADCVVCDDLFHNVPTQCPKAAYCVGMVQS